MTAEEFYTQYCLKQVTAHDKVGGAYVGIVVGYTPLKQGTVLTTQPLVVLGNIDPKRTSRRGHSFDSFKAFHPVFTLEAGVNLDPESFEKFCLFEPSHIMPPAPLLPTPLDLSAYPHRCHCGAPAYVGATDVQCSSPSCRHYILVN